MRLGVVLPAQFLMSPGAQFLVSLDIIDAILEADRSAPSKQRHTAKRISEQLRVEHGFAGSYTTVKDYVRERQQRQREVFVPLAHPPGHAQADFGEAVAVIGGVRQKTISSASTCRTRMPASKAYPAERIEAFLAEVSTYARFS
jgi:transposase